MPWSKEKDFREKLSKLSESQQSIQTLSHWVAFHKANAAHAANVWADEAQRAADPHRQLLLVYLANDVMQNSRRKGTPCADAFASQMATVLPAAHAAATPTVRAKLERLLSIWEERAVMPAPQAAGTCARPHRRRHAEPWYGSYRHSREGREWRARLRGAVEALASQQNDQRTAPWDVSSSQNKAVY
ncbi:hypothetical protein EMIHUDRAFT_195821 [Emiliania huxleyi CCMP1516]|uniref:CID domain-containing protein n=2 Tax=Emiliania huxleyi TaxID=2903 RepID=A0A0D3JI48_EMIH1|nr:hypothetical protein EMIHUDRAFT_195821 [Emiliania huxleyi CCMP1516]EOD23183.1 hypothetical protein EMIHUDRAFT_195821 [Emiliania huxleyi CCMP1516]|eukprot:XP_005775612.1 hypothetical protein EMIHUDRAFT_195821 [Emiliania huxleyi CCMP1516]